MTGFRSEKLEIGDRIELNGKEGVLICHSGMDLSPFDIFNEILINQKDIKYFLKQFNINYNQPLPSMIIQGTV